MLDRGASRAAWRWTVTPPSCPPESRQEEVGERQSVPGSILAAEQQERWQEVQLLRPPSWLSSPRCSHRVRGLVTKSTPLAGIPAAPTHLSLLPLCVRPAASVCSSPSGSPWLSSTVRLMFATCLLSPFCTHLFDAGCPFTPRLAPHTICERVIVAFRVHVCVSLL